MKTKLFVVALSFLIAAGVAVAQPAGPRTHPMNMRHAPMFLAELKLTDQQKADIQKLRYDLMQKQIDLRAQIAHARVDYAQLAAAENPDESAISSKIEDIAKLRGELQKNKLDQWFAINKLLTPEQQKIWKKVLEHPMMFERGMRMHRMMQNRGMGYGMMREGGMMGPNGNMPGRMNMMRFQNLPSPDSGK